MIEIHEIYLLNEKEKKLFDYEGQWLVGLLILTELVIFYHISTLIRWDTWRQAGTKLFTLNHF